MSEYIITDEQLQKDHEQFYEAGQRNRQVWTARVYHGREIVRCKDCEHRYDNQCGRYPDWFDIELDGFCAWGERANFATCKCGEDIETNGRESVTCPSCGRVITE